MSNELHDSFTTAWNASGKFIEAILCLALTIPIALFEGIAKLLRIVRTWLMNGAKLPSWVFPRRPKHETPAQ